MFTLNITDELYTELTTTLNNTRTTKNRITRELEQQELVFSDELDTEIAVSKLSGAEEVLQSNVELLNKILRATTHTNSPHAGNEKNTIEWLINKVKSKHERCKRDGNLVGESITDIIHRDLLKVSRGGKS